VRSVLVADHANHASLAKQNRPTLVVGFGNFGVQSFEDALRHAVGVPDADVFFDARFDVVVHTPGGLLSTSDR
jgi:hypothetical protein